MQGFYERFRFFGMKAVNLALIVSLLVFFSTWAAKAQAHDEEVAQQIAAAERAASRGPYAVDGVFEGSAQGYGGLVHMQVEIVNGYIDRVDILDASSEDAAWLEMAIVLPERIVNAQSTEIDIISGATYTSVGILNATNEALRQSFERGGSA